MVQLNVDGSYCVCTQAVSVWSVRAPRNSCSRRIDDKILARPVKETDLLLLGSGIQFQGRFAFGDDSPWRDVYSPVQWAHLNPAAWGRLCCTACRIKHGIRRSLQCTGIFPGKQAARCMPGAVSLAVHGRSGNLQTYNMQRVSVEMTTWHWLNHIKQKMLKNNYIRQNK